MNTILDFLNNNIGLITLVVGALAYFIYWKQKRDNKRNAAKIILQEIRRAEDIYLFYLIIKKLDSINLLKKLLLQIAGQEISIISLEIWMLMSWIK